MIDPISDLEAAQRLLATLQTENARRGLRLAKQQHMATRLRRELEKAWDALAVAEHYARELERAVNE